MSVVLGMAVLVAAIVQARPVSRPATPLDSAIPHEVVQTANSPPWASLNLHVRSIVGLEIKVHVSLLALACLNLD